MSIYAHNNHQNICFYLEDTSFQEVICEFIIQHVCVFLKNIVELGVWNEIEGYGECRIRARDGECGMRARDSVE